MTGDGSGQGAAEELAHPNLCGLCKSSIGWAKSLGDRYQFRSITAVSCDGCNKLGTILSLLPAVQENFFLDLPRTGTKRDLVYFAGQLKNLHIELAASLGGQADLEALTSAIEIYQGSRRLFRRILDAAYSEQLPIDEAFSAADNFFTLLPDQFAAYANKTLDDLSPPADKTSKPRVFLAGNISNGPGLAETIVRSGAQLVGIDLCHIERAALIEIPDIDDPYQALAEAIYHRPLCARFEPGSDWSKYIGQRAKAAGAGGVILFSLKFCDNTQYSFPMTKQHLEDQGLTVLVIEDEYSQEPAGQIATRIEAFVEML